MVNGKNQHPVFVSCFNSKLIKSCIFQLFYKVRMYNFYLSYDFNKLKKFIRYPFLLIIYKI